MRAFAMTGTETASSAIFACSGVTTSMMTPPLSISAIPRLTFAVPTAPAAVLSAGTFCSDTLVTGTSHVRFEGAHGRREADGRASARWRRRDPGERGRQDARASGRAGGELHGTSQARRPRVVELDGRGHRRVPGEPEQADPPLAAHAQ